MTLQSSELEHFPELTWDQIAPRTSAAIRAALERVLERQNGACLTDDERYRLANSDGEDLLALLVAADTLRAGLVGNIVSYVVNRNINFTNICFVGCKFCAFSRGPREADSYFHSLADMGRKAKEAWDVGATEVCIQSRSTKCATSKAFLAAGATAWRRSTYADSTLPGGRRC